MKMLPLAPSGTMMCSMTTLVVSVIICAKENTGHWHSTVNIQAWVLESRIML